MLCRTYSWFFIPQCMHLYVLAIPEISHSKNHSVFLSPRRRLPIINFLTSTRISEEDY